MKTLKDIQDEVAKENGYIEWNHLLSHRGIRLDDVNKFIAEVCRRAQLECARETLKGLAGQLNQQISFGYVALHSITDEGNIKLVE